MPLSLVLADDHSIFRAGLRTVLKDVPEVQVVAEASDGAQALVLVERLRPDLALLDVDMPELTGIEVARRLHDARALTSVVLLTMHRADSYLEAALEAGVMGYVLKEDAAADLGAALRSVARGELYLSPRVSGAVADVLRRRQRRPATDLTPRERDVVRLLSEGLSSKEIADRLRLTPKTVDGYRSAVMSKLDIHSVAGLVRYALRHHLSRLEE